MAETQKNERERKLLKQILDHFCKEDEAVRQRQLRQWRKLKLYWDNFQAIWFSETAHDWRVWGEETFTGQDQSDYYDKRINVFRAYLESIIAALSVSVPSIQCVPDDADNDLDLQTAKTGNKIAELIYKHNDVILLWIHALYIYCTEGMIAAYSYPKEDESYGTYQEKQYKDEEQEQTQKICPNCKNPIIDMQTSQSLADSQNDEYMPDDDDAAIHALLNRLGTICPICEMKVDPELQTEKVIVPRFVGITTKPKTRQCIEVYGGLYVKVALYAMKQCDTPYLIWSYETHYANVIDRYGDDLKDAKGNPIIKPEAKGQFDPYETWARLSTQYYGEYPTNNITMRNAWFRPCAYNILPEKDDRDYLNEKYPDGVKAIFANECYCCAENESLDDCWTLTHNPLSDYLVHDPLGKLLVPIQEITNDLVSLTLQTIEHGIPQTFADPGVVNFDQYRQTEVAPGTIYPTKPLAGRAVSDGFYEVKTATLSQEVLPFADKMQEAGQMVSGALPSIWGGAAPNSSKTASQYAMSRAQALQRIQTPWKMITIWWKEIFGKVIPSYIKEVKDKYDERLVSKDEMGNFINTYIRMAEMQGKIGGVELEAADNLPISWEQRKDVLMQLMQAANPEVMAALTAPENIEELREAIGLTNFDIPGEDDRTKQYEEIRLLLQSQPIQQPGPPQQMMGPNGPMVMPGPPQEVPTIHAEQQVDKHPIHAEICRNWLVSARGRMAKIDNPQGYKNILLHMQEHINFMQQMAAQAAPPQQQQQQKPMAAPLPRNNNNVTAGVPGTGQ